MSKPLRPSHMIVMLFLASSPTVPICAQETPTESPLVQKIPDTASWQLLFPQNGKALDEGGENRASPETGGRGEAYKADELRVVTVTRTAPTQKVVLRYESGRETEYWMSGDEVFVEENGRVSTGSAGRFSPIYLCPGEAFPGTSWVRMDAFRGEAQFRGKRCHYYEVTETDQQAEALANKLGQSTGEQVPTYRAWIDVETRLPVAVSMPQGSFVFRFREAPSGPLNFPAAFAERRDRDARELRRRQAEASVR